MEVDQVDLEFFKKYHRAVVKANAESVEKLKSKMGSEFAEEFRRKTGTTLKGEEFNAALERYLRDELRFCDEVAVKGDDEELSVAVKGCRICQGNEVLKKEGGPALCPIVPTGLFSLSRVAESKATLKEVRKSGVVGECEICYQLK